MADTIQRISTLHDINGISTVTFQHIYISPMATPISIPAPSVPAFRDIAKSSNDVLQRDFYHSSPLSLKARTTAPNGVSFSVSGVSDSKSDSLNGNLETKYADKATGVTLTQGWLTSNVLNTRVEMNDAFSPGLNGAVNTRFEPGTGARSANVGLTYKHPGVNANVVADVFKSAFTGNVVFGHKGFVSGAEIAYDIRKGQIKQYGTTIGYIAPAYSASVSTANNFSVYSASIYHRVNPNTELGASATWKKLGISDAIKLEAAVKHKLDSSSFVKAKLDNYGIAALSYSQIIRPGVTLGVGLEANIEKLNESSHKVGLSLDFSA